MPSSPTRSSFTPLSLTDSLARPTSSRTLHRTPSSQEVARVKAALMCDSLGITRNNSSMIGSSVASSAGTVTNLMEEDEAEEARDESTRPLSATSDAAVRTPGPASTTDWKDAELVRVKKELANLRKANRELSARNIVLEQEKKALVAAAKEAAVSRDSRGTALGATQLEELERSFASQEALLVGYQREAETSFGTIETLKRQQRRLTDFLSTHFGPEWQSDLSLHLDRPAGSALPLPDKVVANGSPVVRTKLAARRTSLGLQNAPLASARSFESRFEPTTFEEEGGDGEAPDMDSSSRDGQAAIASEHVAHVAKLVEQLDARLTRRAEELEVLERAARAEMSEAEERSRKLEELVRNLMLSAS